MANPYQTGGYLLPNGRCSPTKRADISYQTGGDNLPTKQAQPNRFSHIGLLPNGRGRSISYLTP